MSMIKLNEKEFPEEFQKQFEIAGRTISSVKGVVAGLGSAGENFLNLRIIHKPTKKQWEMVGIESDINYLANCLFKRLYQQQKDKLIEELKE